MFEATYSYEAVGDVVAPLFDGCGTNRRRSRLGSPTLADLPRHLFGPKREGAAPGGTRPRTKPGAVMPGGPQYDLVMFWKQNDTGLYGRRQDMFLKYLARSDRVGSDRALRQPDDARHAVQDRIATRQLERRPGPARRAPDGGSAAASRR